MVFQNRGSLINFNIYQWPGHQMVELVITTPASLKKIVWCTCMITTEG